MDNCLTFAIRMARYGRTDNYMLIRKSHWGWFPHVAVMFELANGDLVRYEYVPNTPRPRWIPPLFFKGEVKVTYYKREDDGPRQERICNEHD